MLASTGTVITYVVLGLVASLLVLGLFVLILINYF